jgi:hypothetical protein
MRIFPTKETREKWVNKAREIALLLLIVEILLVIAFALGCKNDIIKAEEEKLVIPVSAKEKEPKQIEQPKDEVSEIAEFIWEHESSRGKNNYSKCAAIGKVNGIGFGIPGNGSYQCFKDHAEEMQVLKGWVIDKQSRGMTKKQLLCLYSGNNYEICK